MFVKIRESFLELLKKLKKSIAIRHLCVVVSVFKEFYESVKDYDEKFYDMLNSLFLFLASLVLIFFIIVILGGLYEFTCV